MSKTIYNINKSFKNNDGKLYHNYFTDLLDDDSQFNNNYKEILLDINLLQLKVKFENKLIFEFIYNTKHTYIDTDSLIDYLINKINFSHITFENQESKIQFLKKYNELSYINQFLS